MSIKKYVNNAWQEITQLKKYLNNAWQDCEFARKFENNAWVDVWNLGVKALFDSINLNSGGTYSYSISEDKTTLTFSVNGTSGSASNLLIFKLAKNGGFGKTIKVKYTLKQTVSTTGSTFLTDMTGNRNGKTNSVWYRQSTISSPTTYEGTITLDTDQTCLYLMIGPYQANSISGVISNVYINDELVKFEG